MILLGSCNRNHCKGYSLLMLLTLAFNVDQDTLYSIDWQWPANLISIVQVSLPGSGHEMQESFHPLSSLHSGFPGW